MRGSVAAVVLLAVTVEAEVVLVVGRVASGHRPAVGRSSWPQWLPGAPASRILATWKVAALDAGLARVRANRRGWRLPLGFGSRVPIGHGRVPPQRTMSQAMTWTSSEAAATSNARNSGRILSSLSFECLLLVSAR
jgi:hypothetical protein